jgi:hypothetical protein
VSLSRRRLEFDAGDVVNMGVVAANSEVYFHFAGNVFVSLGNYADAAPRNSTPACLPNDLIASERHDARPTIQLIVL